MNAVRGFNWFTFDQSKWKLVKRVLCVILLVFAIGFVYLMAPRNLTPIVAVLIGLASLVYVISKKTLPLVVSSVLFLTVTLSPLDVDFTSSGGDIRILPVRVGFVTPKPNSQEYWGVGCLMSLYDPRWMVTWRPRPNYSLGRHRTET